MLDTVGFIGLGIMGKPMAHNLLKAGFAVIVTFFSDPGDPCATLICAMWLRDS